MPWKECIRTDERLRFTARLLEGAKMSAVCREFGISRPTGHKIFNRYKDFGLRGLHDRSRRPYRHANQLPFQVKRVIMAIKREHTSRGARKVRDKLVGDLPMIHPPACSTVHPVFDRNGLVARRKRHRHKAQGIPLVHAGSPNVLWCADYKGEIRMGNRRYCYPLTITDYSSRYLLARKGIESTKATFALAVFERASKEYGRPQAIRTDNGAPFVSCNALFGLSRLAVWWLHPKGDLGQ